jgi:hypothetical protein
VANIERRLQDTVESGLFWWGEVNGEYDGIFQGLSTEIRHGVATLLLLGSSIQILDNTMLFKQYLPANVF